MKGQDVRMKIREKFLYILQRIGLLTGFSAARLQKEKSPERSVEEKLAQLEEEFRRSAEYVLKKNADLYRRLS